jgi:predicted negative regulator of RcsB-dependent stress response
MVTLPFINEPRDILPVVFIIGIIVLFGFGWWSARSNDPEGSDYDERV